MSRKKVSVLTVTLFALVAIVLLGVGGVAKSSSGESGVAAAACGENAASTRPTDGCGARAMTSNSCPMGAATSDAGKGCPMSSHASKSGCSSSCVGKPSKTAKVESIEYREGRTVVMEGRYVCGACELGIGENCQPAFRSTDGKNYLLVRNNLSKQLRNDARDKDVEIVSRVRKLDGVKYLEVEVVRPLS